MKCLVLGGAGFLGSHLIDGLLDEGHEVRVFEKKGVSFGNIERHFARIEVVESDFSDAGSVRESLRGIEVVFHFVGTTLPHTSNENPTFDVMSNLIPTLSLLDGCRDLKVKKVLFTSSGGTVYGIPEIVPIPEEHPTNPICSYGIQKLTIEKYLELYYCLYGLDYAAFRISNPYGKRQRTDTRQGAVAVFLKNALRRRPIEIWGDGGVVRDYLHVSDVVRAMMIAMATKTEHRVFNIGSGIGHSLVDVISTIERVLGYQIEKRFLAARPSDVPANVLSIQRARELLGWEPMITFEDGIARMLDV